MFSSKRQAIGSVVDTLPEPVRCSQTWARRFMAIASNETMINRKSTADLPPSVDILAALAAIDAPSLKVAFSEGWIMSELLHDFVTRK